MAFLNFNEASVEREASLNGDLQWLLQPPFFRETSTAVCFFLFEMGFTSHQSFSGSNERRVDFRIGEGETSQRLQLECGTEEAGIPRVRRAGLRRGQPLLCLFEVTLKRSSDLSSGRTVWRSEKLTVDPMVYRHLSVKVMLAKKDLSPNEALVLQWSSKQSDQTQEVWLEWPSKGKFAKAEATVWLYPGRYVDWLLAGVISELIVEVPQGVEVVFAQLSSAMPVESKRPLEHIDHYRNPELKFEWSGRRSWWELGTLDYSRARIVHQRRRELTHLFRISFAYLLESESQEGSVSLIGNPGMFGRSLGNHAWNVGN